MKRKRRDIALDSPDDLSPSSKRRRTYSNIEDGFAYLSLSGSSYHPNHAFHSISVEEISPELAMDTDMPSASPSQAAYTVEEPTVPEIDMKTSSWFELERDRIVITDLDAFTQSDDEEEQNVAVNTALLDRIRANTVSKSLPAPAPSTSQALVLFRPLSWAGAINEESKQKALKEVDKEKKDVKADEEDMAMQIEL